MVYRLLHGHVAAQVYEFGGHYAAGRIVGILQVAVDYVARFSGGVLEHALYHSRRQFLQHIDRVVHIQLLNYLPQLAVGGAFEYHLLHVAVQVGKHVRRQLLGQRAEQQPRLLGREAAQELGNIHLVHPSQPLAQFLYGAALEQFAELFKIKLGIHWHVLLCANYLRTAHKNRPAPNLAQPCGKPSMRAQSAHAATLP